MLVARAVAPARAACAAAAAELLVPAPWLALRRGLPDRLPHRAERHRLQRDRRRLRERGRRAEGARRAARSTAVPVRQRTRRHLRPVLLRGLRPVRRAVRLQRHLGRPAGGARGGDRLRPARASALLFLLGRRMRGPDRASCSPTRGWPIRSPRSRSSATPTTRSSPRSSSATLLAASSLRRRRARRARGARRPGEVRAARARAAARDRSACASAPARRAARSRSSPRLRGGRAARVLPALAHDSLHDDLRAHDRLPGGPRRAVLDLGPLRRPAGRADGRRARSRSCSRSGSRCCRAGATSAGSPRPARGADRRRSSASTTGSTSTSRGSSPLRR